jgi:hypothetical protein
MTELQRRNVAFARLRAVVTVHVKDPGAYEQALAALDTLDRLLPVESFTTQD